MYNVYNSFQNTNTRNFGGMEWIIDGENGKYNYPGTYPEEYCRRLYQKGISWQKILREYNKGNITKAFQLRSEGNI